jgi:glutamine synthetase
MLGAGLAGIEAETDLPPEASNNIYEMSPAERETADDHVHEFLIRNKLAEWDGFKAYVNPYELERYTRSSDHHVSLRHNGPMEG